MRLIGIDCATDDAKVGVAMGSFAAGTLSIDEVLLCSRDRAPATVVCEWVRSSDLPVLIALDAPLGWPQALGPTLAVHSAGKGIAVGAHAMFRRTTDLFIHEALGKTPLDVGADRIARTAHSALALLGVLRGQLDATIPLAWSPVDLNGISAIEVYPAATLLAHGFRSAGYKKPAERQERREMLADLKKVARFSGGEAAIELHADALDAAVCVVAAADFVAGHACPPRDHTAAIREGWIWTRLRRPLDGREAGPVPEG